MKCIIKNCDKEANLPFQACDRLHGYEWNQIKSALEYGSKQYQQSPFHRFTKWLTEEDINYYKEFLPLRKENDATKN